MGTNFYFAQKPCQTCHSVKEKKHIGKSSGGWQFHFRGYLHESIVSWQNWLNEFQDENKVILNEYDEIISLEKFKKIVEDPERKKLLNHFNAISKTAKNEAEKEYLKERQNTRISHCVNTYDFTSWQDAEGYSFTDNDFC